MILWERERVWDWGGMTDDRSEISLKEIMIRQRVTLNSKEIVTCKSDLMMKKKGGLDGRRSKGHFS